MEESNNKVDLPMAANDANSVQPTVQHNVGYIVLKSLNPEVNDASAPFPYQLSTTDDARLINFKSSLCCEYNYPMARRSVTSNEDLKWGLARASHPIPQTSELFYFEVKILNDGNTKEIEIGLTMSKNSNFVSSDDVNIGYDGYGYRGRNGNLYQFCWKGDGEIFGQTFEKDDVIGCGVNSIAQHVFFTKNGEIIGLANRGFRLQDQEWFPAVSLKGKNAKVEFNFGANPFIFKICTARYLIKTRLVIDPQLDYGNKSSMRDEFLVTASKLLNVPRQAVALMPFRQMQIHLLAKTEEEKTRILELIDSTSFLTNMRLEMNKIDKEIMIKSNGEPEVDFLTGTLQPLCPNPSKEQNNQKVGSDGEKSRSGVTKTENAELLQLPNAWQETKTEEAQVFSEMKIAIQPLLKPFAKMRPMPLLLPIREVERKEIQELIEVIPSRPVETVYCWKEK